MLAVKDLIYLLSKCRPDDDISFEIDGDFGFQFLDDQFTDVYSEVFDDDAYSCTTYIKLTKSMKLFRENVNQSKQTTCKACLRPKSKKIEILKADNE